jgi:hypothetical protein
MKVMLLKNTVLTAFISLFALPAFSASLNGFDLAGSLIPENEIHRGGPAKDGIPSIDEPKFVSAKKANIEDKQRVLGVYFDGVAKAYPINILNWHEIVNDSINGTPFVVTFCPLCGTGLVFDAHVNGERLEFGVSGLLYNSDVLLFDRQSDSLWSQIESKSVVGKFKGQALTLLNSRHTSWADWQKRYPDTLVLSQDTGFSRNYNRDPYSSYYTMDSTYFPVSHKAPKKWHPKERVLGLNIGNQSKAWPFIELEKAFKDTQEGVLAATLNQTKVFIHWDAHARNAYVLDEEGNEIPSIQAFWFAWFTFHPDTSIFEAE